MIRRTGLLAAVLLAGCAYQLRAPAALPEGLRVAIVDSDARLAAVRPALHRHVSARVHEQLAWALNPRSATELALAIQREDIDAIAEDARGISNRWRIRLLVTARFRGEEAEFSDNASYSSLDDDDAAIERVAAGLARDIVRWLEVVSYDQ